MPSIEVSAKTVEQAIEDGLAKLNKTIDEVDDRIISSGGIFRKAKVMLTIFDGEGENLAEKAKSTIALQAKAKAGNEKPEKQPLTKENSLLSNDKDGAKKQENKPFERKFSQKNEGNRANFEGKTSPEKQNAAVEANKASAESKENRQQPVGNNLPIKRDSKLPQNGNRNPQNENKNQQSGNRNPQGGNNNKPKKQEQKKDMPFGKREERNRDNAASGRFGKENAAFKGNQEQNQPEFDPENKSGIVFSSGKPPAFKMDNQKEKPEKPSRSRGRNNNRTSLEEGLERIFSSASKTDFDAEVEQKIDERRYEKREHRSDRPRTEMTQPVAENAISFVEGLLGLMNIDYGLAHQIEDGELKVKLDCENGSIIGYRGETLDSIEYLTSLVVNKSDDKYFKVVIDCNDYRKKRIETLSALAKRLAEKAVKSGRKVIMEPMSSSSRKIIHSILSENDRIVTKSEGKEPTRHIVIIPKRY
jgi:spoIIIJ-associated protein